nr:integrase, catalytic region, zinc finger, CCHC-type, peptidase aspartic, catalytic [Tanacetum cinerariifolium]
IYTLINHYIDAKDIGDNVKMLLEGSELTKEDRESQLYDDFEHFRQHKGESIHDYYVRFAKLINDMRNIKMTMSTMQLNSKFMNNMLPEWDRFVTAIKLNRGLKDSNYDQLGHGMNPWGRGAAGYGEVQNRVGNADDCDAFDSDVDEALTVQTMFMANLASADPVTDEAGPSYDLDILFEVRDHDHYQDAVCGHHEEHAMHDSVQLNHVIDSQADYTSDSNMILYDQYVKDNEHALYNGHEIVKDNHAPTIVHNIEDTLEIAKITRKKMNDKIKDPECVTRKVKIAPHDYSKENFLATFTHQKQLTPEQIFWSQDLIKLKSEAVKEQTIVSRPIKALTVYPPNTPATLVPRVLPTKSQVKILLASLFCEADIKLCLYSCLL